MQDKHREGEAGQAAVMVALAMSIFLIGAVGLAIDGSHIYAEFQMAQTAADSAAQAAMMSIFDGTNGAGSARFSTVGQINCNVGKSDPRTPCAYAARNGFGTTAAGSPKSTDTVTVSFPKTAPANVTLSTNPEDIGPGETTIVQVTVTRPVLVTLMGMLGASSPTISATATAAIVNVSSPAPLVVTHPTLSGALTMNGSATLKICGGPGRAIQVNSGDGNAVKNPGGGTIDLSTAGPGLGGCNGKGADLGVWGGPDATPIPLAGGQYLQPSSPVLDPLYGIAAPPVPAAAVAPSPLGNGFNGCPNPNTGPPCKLYSPGLYPGGIDGTNQTMIFSPGIYYISSDGLTCSTNCDMYMATAGLPDTTTLTGWTQNMLVYNTGNNNAADVINIGGGGTVNLTGAPLTDPNYPGILLFENHFSSKHTHTLGGPGGTAMNLTGSVYMTNAAPTAGTYQTLQIYGGSTNTNITGHVVVDALHIEGSLPIQIDLENAALLNLRQVAMVN